MISGHYFIREPLAKGGSVENWRFWQPFGSILPCLFSDKLRKPEAVIPSASGRSCRSLFKQPFLAIGFAVASALCLGLMGTAYAEELNGVEFSCVYDAARGRLPSDSGLLHEKWSISGKLEQNAVIDLDGRQLLHFRTPLEGAAYYQLWEGPWQGNAQEGSPGTTVEFKVKVVSQPMEASSACSVFFSTGTSGYSITLSTTGVRINRSINGPEIAFDTTNDFHTYRFVLEGNGTGRWNLYIDNDSAPLMSGGEAIPTSSNHIYFGDSSSVEGGESYWEYIGFTNSGAFPPKDAAK